MTRSKMDVAALKTHLQAILARNLRVLAIMKRVESADIPEGKTPLDVLAEELEREGLSEVIDEAT